jgi:polysaccharide biosynthesis transport protein
LQQRLLGINQGINFIDREMPKLRERVEVLQLPVKRLRQQRNLFDPVLEGKSLSEQVQSIRSKQVEIRVQLKGMRNLYQSYEKLLNENNPQGRMMTQGQAYGGILGQIQKIDSDLSMKLAQYREDSLQILALRKSREELMLTATREAKEVVMGNLETQIKEIEARDREMTAWQKNLNQKIRNFSVTTRQYDNLQQELQVVTQSLSDFLAKREALRIDAAQQQVPWVRINPPEIPLDKRDRYITATVKQTKKQLALAVILIGLLGIAVGLLEVLNTVFHSPESLRMATKLLILGVIPFTKKVKDPAPARLRKLTSARSNSKVEVVEAGEAKPTGPMLGGAKSFERLGLSIFRSISIALHEYSLAQCRQGDSIARGVSSAVAGDGKSTVALHLAATAAAVGQRVLLVDADLRCPQLHAKLGLPNLRGERQCHLHRHQPQRRDWASA